jgi:hypothetical protein
MYVAFSDSQCNKAWCWPNVETCSRTKLCLMYILFQSARHRNLYLTTHNTNNRLTSMSPVGFEPILSAYERPQTHALDRAAIAIGLVGSVKENQTPTSVDILRLLIWHDSGYIELFHIVHSHTIKQLSNYTNQMHNICSLHTFTVFHLHVSVLHSTSSGRNCVKGKGKVSHQSNTTVFNSMRT